MNAPQAIRLVVLDWAGTTVDFGCFAPVASFARALGRHGVEPTDEQVRRPMGLAKRDHLRALLEIPGLAGQFRARHGRGWDESDVDRIYRETTSRSRWTRSPATIAWSPGSWPSSRRSGRGG